MIAYSVSVNIDQSYGLELMGFCQITRICMEDELIPVKTVMPDNQIFKAYGIARLIAVLFRIYSNDESFFIKCQIVILFALEQIKSNIDDVFS